MKKYLFVSVKKFKFQLIILYFIIFLIFLYSASIYIYINQKYFIILNKNSNSFYIIPEDKQGEKIKYIDKKSINNFVELKKDNKNFNINDLKYTIQLYSDVNFENIENYKNKILKLKSEIISTEELYIFSIYSLIGTDYFLTYMNFDKKNDALEHCKKLSFVKKCLILKPQNY
tara:strand:- start:29 stop:547 length:519 start_codon:yes stop_codon:yes gene_type:complete